MNRFPPFGRCALGFGQCEAPAHADHERKERDEDGKVGKLLIDREGRGAQDRQAEKTCTPVSRMSPFTAASCLFIWPKIDGKKPA